MWDIKSGRPLFHTELPLNNGAFSVRFSPNSRLFVVATRAMAGASGKALILSSDTGQLIREFDHRTAHVWDAVFTLDGQRLITAAQAFTEMPSHNPRDTGIRIWNVADGRQLRCLPLDLYFSDKIALSPDGKRFAVGVAPVFVKVFELDSGKELATLAGHRESITALVYSPSESGLRTWRTWISNNC